ncbi:calcium-binding protein [Microcystis aeruginosa]|uniref:Uncharacterized protein n=1 Tax=Microcystis aeruginosa PCC 9717 TaxID=1160286 RepID=I4FN46_MICAE|nr:calcium-binding protein [Microcystis aeruginosa]CCH97071.1 exported hypothetical protein [Microcystis aeruginosa PCC 9717]
MNEQLKQCAKAAFMLASAPFAFIESVAFADIQFKDIRLEINARSSGDVLFPPPVFDSMGFTMYGNDGQDSFLIENEAKDFLIGNEGQDSFLIENEAKDFLIGNEGQDTFLIENETKDFLIGGEGQDFLMMREDSTYSFLIENEVIESIADASGGHRKLRINFLFLFQNKAESIARPTRHSLEEKGLIKSRWLEKKGLIKSRWGDERPFVSFLIENEAKFVNPFQFKRLLDHIISHRKQDMIEEAREFLIRNKQLTLLALQNTLTTLLALQNTLTLVFSVAEINPISISGQIWTDKVEGKVEVRQLLLTTYTIACTCIRQSLKFIRGLRSTTKSNLSSTCSNTILGFFLTGSCCVQF